MGSMHPVQVIAVTGGKGGVGKTNVSVNLSIALAEMGRRVMLMDADLGLANVDVLLGLTPKYTLADVVEGRCELRDVLQIGGRLVRSRFYKRPQLTGCHRQRTTTCQAQIKP